MSAARKSNDRFSGAAGKSNRFLQGKNLPLRKAASTASTASRRLFPAWISADEGAVTFSAASVSPRVRTALVLRLVKPSKSTKSKGASDGRAAR